MILQVFVRDDLVVFSVHDEYIFFTIASGKEIYVKKTGLSYEDQEMPF